MSPSSITNKRKLTRNNLHNMMQTYFQYGGHLKIGINFNGIAKTTLLSV